MLAIQEILFPQPTIYRSPRAVIRWWERRRLTYNVAVGATGLVTLTVAVVASRIMGERDVTPFFAMSAAYAIVANICYSSGAVVELIVDRWLKRPSYGVGPALFRHGLVFSVGLTILPAFILSGITVIMLVTRWL